MFSAMITFDLLARELAGKVRPRRALAHATNAAELPDPRFPPPAVPQLVWVGREEAEDSPRTRLRYRRRFSDRVVRR
jgi:hypothetical protein